MAYMGIVRRAYLRFADDEAEAFGWRWLSKMVILWIVAWCVHRWWERD
jgi:hypothetical protein